MVLAGTEGVNGAGALSGWRDCNSNVVVLEFERLI